MDRFGLNAALKIILPAGAPEPLLLAAGDLARDIRSVADPFRPEIVSGPADSDAVRIDVVPERFSPGSLEAYHVYSLPGNVLQIEGADMRGAIYGIYEFSRRFLGIQPDHLWSFSPVRKLSSTEWSGIDFASGTPLIRYRGIFINDEDLLTGWDPGGTREVDYSFYHRLFSVRTAEIIAETAIRMGYNLAIPASFMNIRNPQEEELLKVFARRGFILSMHHIEPLGVSAFSFASFWKARGEEHEYSYFSDPDAMREVWTDSVRRWSKYPEVIWQLGLRGRTDRPFWTVGKAPKTAEGRAAVIGKAILEQLNLVRSVTGDPDPVCTSTLWGEISVFNRQGILPLPKGVIRVFADNCAGWRLQDDFFASPVAADERYGVYCHHAMNVGTHLAQAIGPADFRNVLKGALRVRPLDYAIFNVANVREFVCGMTATARITRDCAAFSPDSFLHEWTKAHFSACGEEIEKSYEEYFGAFEKNRRGAACWNDMLLLREVDLAVWKVYGQPDWVRQLDPTHLEALKDMFPAIKDTSEKLSSLERLQTVMTRIHRRAEGILKRLPEAERPFFYAQMVYPAGLYKAFCTAAISSVRGAEAYAAKDYVSARENFSAALAAMKEMEKLVPDYLCGPFRHWYDLCPLADFRSYTKKLERLLKEKIELLNPETV